MPEPQGNIHSESDGIYVLVDYEVLRRLSLHDLIKTLLILLKWMLMTWECLN